jgi:hypothetical protein
MLTPIFSHRNLPFIRNSAATAFALFSVAALAGSPPLMKGDGDGPIGLVPPFKRPACTSIDSTSSLVYPRGLGLKKAMKQPSNGSVDDKPPVIYVETPVIPGAQVRKTAASGGRFQYCVRPFLVNTGASASPAGIAVYLTRNAATQPNDFGSDTALVTAFAGSTPLSKIVESIPAGATKLVTEVWCTTLSESAAKGLSLFVNVPAQSLLVQAGNGASTGSVGSTSPSASAQKRATSASTPATQPAVRVPTQIQEYSTVCKLDFDTEEQSTADPQPRVLRSDPIQQFSSTSAVRPAFLPVTVSRDQQSIGAAKEQLFPK